MYQVLIDGRDLYYPGDEEYTASDATVKLQLNDSAHLNVMYRSRIRNMLISKTEYP